MTKLANELIFPEKLELLTYDDRTGAMLQLPREVLALAMLAELLLRGKIEMTSNAGHMGLKDTDPSGDEHLDFALKAIIEGTHNDYITYCWGCINEAFRQQGKYLPFIITQRLLERGVIADHSPPSKGWLGILSSRPGVFSVEGSHRDDLVAWIRDLIAGSNKVELEGALLLTFLSKQNLFKRMLPLNEVSLGRKRIEEVIQSNPVSTRFFNEM